MSIEILNQVPAYHVWLPHEDFPPKSKVWWSGSKPPPAIGEEIVIGVNKIGSAVVVGYFVQDKWLGVACDVEKWPPILAEQNGDNMRAFIFGAEIK